ncbi:hypothetical protein M9H77_18773 [Catharanthus roseus]|uniref:Uncharacterized protein n=1 Tax=Catharanthus roseus TaxID=4058 RepID=A0ACC0B8J3_CATRO|nr:hypothetical protein M9H77_18773 [Catharanthus roseus]
MKNNLLNTGIGKLQMYSSANNKLVETKSAIKILKQAIFGNQILSQSKDRPHTIHAHDFSTLSPLSRNELVGLGLLTNPSPRANSSRVKPPNVKDMLADQYSHYGYTLLGDKKKRYPRGKVTNKGSVLESVLGDILNDHD